MPIQTNAKKQNNDSKSYVIRRKYTAIKVKKKNTAYRNMCKNKNVDFFKEIYSIL